MMKWWGWGDANKSFPMESKPTLWPWIQGKLAVQNREKVFPIVEAKIKLNPPVINSSFTDELKNTLKASQFKNDAHERLVHSYGKSFPDLFRVRRGEIKRAPDMILWPESHQDVEAIINLANRHNVCVVPFGGGTNIVGGIEVLDFSERMVCCLDMGRMNKLLQVDPYSMIATIQAGALGPKLEADLQEKGFALGHYPDSFEYSTLGGWLATRSAGMQSDAYGKIEDMVVSLKMVTPSGTIATRTVPASSAGPDLNQLICGSEGILGVITEATMRVHRSPAVKDYRGYLFRTFEDGLNAIHECVDRGFSPSMIRLQDSGETELALHMKSPKKGIEALIQKPIKAYLKSAGYSAPCIMIIGFEGDEDAISSSRAGALKIMKKHGGFSLGKGVGKTWSADKFNIPYLRDYVMDYACTADVAETSATWKNILPLYNNTIKATKSLFQKEGGAGYVGCHISHTYKTGACLYFTWAAKQILGEELEQYYRYKKFITDTFIESGGTVSHHHAIGYEHKGWMEVEVSRTGLQALQAVKASLDPKSILNPGKLLPENLSAVSEDLSNAESKTEKIAMARMRPADLQV